VVNEPIDHGGSYDGVAEDFSPSAEQLVGGDDDRGSFVSGRHELEEQVRCFGFERDVADLINDEEGDAAESGQFVSETTGGVGLSEPGDPVGGGRERDAVTGLAGPDS